MKRILILVALSLFLCSTASTFQDGGGKSTKNPEPKPKAPSAPKPKVEPHKRSSTPTPANISLKLGKDKSVSQETGSFGPGDTIYGVAKISNAPGKVKVKGRLIVDDVEGQQSGPIPGLETTVELAGSGTATFTFTPPPAGWPNGKYEIEVLMLNEDGEQKGSGRRSNLSVSADNTTRSEAPAPSVREEEERRALPKAPMNAANTKANPTAGIGALPLRGFEFDVVTVNSSGSETSRRKGHAQYCTEEIAGMSLELVVIPGGTFLMGSTENDREKPPHQVTVGSFYMGKYEVTQAQWLAAARLPKVSRDLDSDRSQINGDIPVDQVSWEDAMEFCARLSRATGRIYRLPTEAEWEYACRAGTTTPFAFGETITPQIVNYRGEHPYAQAPTGTYREKKTPAGFMGVANGFGLFDMHGNVWEWCMDYWNENYNGAPTDGRSWEAAGDTDRRVQRGGSWLWGANECRSAYRSSDFAGSGQDTVGFRVVAVVRTP